MKPINNKLINEMEKFIKEMQKASNGKYCDFLVYGITVGDLVNDYKSLIWSVAHNEAENGCLVVASNIKKRIKRIVKDAERGK